MYSTKSQRVNYLVGDKVFTLTHLDRTMQVVGYMVKEGRVLLVDKERNLVTFELVSQYLQYMNAVLCGNLDLAEDIFPKLPGSLHSQVARFLHQVRGTKQLCCFNILGRCSPHSDSGACTALCPPPPSTRPQTGHPQRALEVSPDADHRFDLALELDQLELAVSIAEQFPDEQRKWRLLGDSALQAGKVGCTWHSLHPPEKSPSERGGAMYVVVMVLCQHCSSSSFLPCSCFLLLLLSSWLLWLLVSVAN